MSGSLKAFLVGAALAAAAFIGVAFPSHAQSPVQWQYSFGTSGYAIANYPGAVTVGAPTGGDQGIGTINATGLYINGVAVVAGGGSGCATGAACSFASVNVTGTTPPTQGIYSGTGTNVSFSVSSTSQFEIVSNFFRSVTSGGAAMNKAATSATVPGLIPNRNDSTSGIGAQAAGAVSLIASGAEQERWTSSGGIVGNPTGGAKGAGTINATGLYVNGTAVSTGTTGGWTLLNTLTASSSATLSDVTSFTATYNTYVLEFQGFTPASASNLNILYTTNGGTTWLATGYVNVTSGSIACTSLDLTGSITAMALNQLSYPTTGASGQLTFSNPNAAVASAAVLVGQLSAGGKVGTIGCTNTTASAINGLQFSMSSGNIASGKILIYGVK